MLDANGVTIYGKSVLSESLDTHVRSYPKSASSAAMLSNTLLFLSVELALDPLVGPDSKKSSRSLLIIIIN